MSEVRDLGHFEKFFRSVRGFEVSFADPCRGGQRRPELVGPWAGEFQICAPDTPVRYIPRAGTLTWLPARFRCPPGDAYRVGARLTFGSTGIRRFAHIGTRLTSRLTESAAFILLDTSAHRGRDGVGVLDSGCVEHFTNQPIEQSANRIPSGDAAAALGPSQV